MSPLAWIIVLTLATICGNLGETLYWRLFHPQREVRLGRKGSRGTSIGIPVRQIGRHRYELDADASLADTLEVVVRALREVGEG